MATLIADTASNARPGVRVEWLGWAAGVVWANRSRSAQVFAIIQEYHGALYTYPPTGWGHLTFIHLDNCLAPPIPPPVPSSWYLWDLEPNQPIAERIDPATYYVPEPEPEPAIEIEPEPVVPTVLLLGPSYEMWDHPETLEEWTAHEYQIIPQEDMTWLTPETL